MKVKISYVVDVSDDMRRGIRMHYGEKGLATRQEIKDWYEAQGHSCDDDIQYSGQDNEE